MKGYIYLSAGTVFLIVLVNFIIPEGKMHKSVNFVLRLACIFILVSPILKIFDLSVPSSQNQLTDYDYVCSVYSESQSAQLEKLIYDNLGIDCECRVEITFESGAICENGVSVYADFVEEGTFERIQAYLQSLGYININVHEKADLFPEKLQSRSNNLRNYYCVDNSRSYSRQRRFGNFSELDERKEQN